MKKLIFILGVALCPLNSIAQEYIDYQGTRYPTHSSLSQDNPTVKIRPFNEQKFRECDGIVEYTINGKIINLDCKKIYVEDLTNEILEVPYEVNDTATYGKIVEQRINYIKNQIILLSEIKELIPNLKTLHGQEPLGNTQKIYFSTLIENRKEVSFKALEAAHKAEQKNRFDKKLEEINTVIEPKIDSELSYMKSLLSSADDWDKILSANIRKSCLVRPDNYPNNEDWAKDIIEIKRATAIAKIDNPFLLDAIGVPNPNYEEVAIKEGCKDEGLKYQNPQYNYSMKIPSCFQSEFEIFLKNGGGEYDMLYGKGEYEEVELDIANAKHSMYMYLDGNGIYNNDMSGGVYRQLSSHDGETNKKTIDKQAFSNGYVITCSLTYAGKSCISKFYAINLRNNVQLRFYLRYPTSKKDEFESFIPQMLESIEAY